MAQQTAVEWLICWMSNNQYFIGDDLLQAFEQAKQMEKEQIINAFEHGHTNGVDKSFCMDNPMLKNSEQYYNETYKK